MAEIKIEVETKKVNGNFKPVTLSDGAVVEISYTIGETKSLTGIIKKDGQENGRFSYNPEINRAYLQISPLNNFTEDVVKEVVEVFLTCFDSLSEL